MKLIPTTFIALAVASSGAVAEQPRWEVARYPFLPYLTSQRDPATCASFLDLTIQAYQGNDFEIDLQDRPWPGAEWIFSSGSIGARNIRSYEPSRDFASDTLTELERNHTAIASYEADIDRDGTPEVLALMSWVWSWRGSTHALLWFDDPAQFAGALAAATSPGEFADRATGEINGAQNSGSEGSRGFSWTWEMPLVVKLNDRFYLLEQGETYDDDVALRLYEISSHGAMPLCEAKLVPGDRGFAATSLAGTPVGALENLAREISGEEPACGGTMHSQSRTLGEGGRVASRIALRPWVVAAWEPYNDGPRVQRGIAHWGAQSLWNHRKERQVPAALAEASAFLAEYYRVSFGLAPDFAAAAAARNADILFRGFFVFSSTYEPPIRDDLETRLRAALLNGADRESVAALLAEGAAITNIFESRVFDGNYEPTLFYALEHPQLVQLLLSRGADVNARGNFGKTALMYAAQFNLGAAAELLLAARAEVNAVTSAGQSCTDTRLDTTQRTALMYAAGNADTALVRALLAAGADPQAKDSHGRDAKHYVAGNAALTAAQRLEMVGVLRAAAGTATP